MRAEMGKDPTRAPPAQLNLPPGFRFYPTDEELVVHYLCKKAACEPFAVPIIAEVELYKFDPWDLPEKALFGEKEWYFFSPRDRKYPNGSRPNRAAGTGYWKATGTDKPISTMGGSKKVGVKKALVFYKGKAPKGVKTNWIMHEYRLATCSTPRPNSAKRKSSLRLDDWVLCRIYKKSSSAAVQMKLESIGDADVKTEQSDSSSFDNVLATLSELDDPTTHEAQEEEEADHDTHIDMQDVVSPKMNFYQQGATDLGAYMRELHNRGGMMSQGGNGGNDFYTAALPAAANYESRQQNSASTMPIAVATPESIVSSRQHSPLESYSTRGMMSQGGNGGNDFYTAAPPAAANYESQQKNIASTMPVVAATPESIVSSQQHSPLESYSTSGHQEEEDMTGETTFNSLAGLPLTQLLNTQNFPFQSNMGLSSPCSMLANGLDMGLPSPCSMLANGGSFGGGSLIDPDIFLFQPSYLGWDPTRA